jgi:L-ascorbate metabolism protein UlaG (beta-lactamase superfamily)
VNRRAALWTLGVALPALLAAGRLGWLDEPKAWPRATGWEMLPPDQRPSSARVFAPRPGLPAPRLEWLGHSGFVLRWNDTTVLIDPNVSARCTLSRRVLASRPDVAELGPIDAALISHAHFDHLDLPTLRSIPGLANLVVPEGAESYVDAAWWPGVAIRVVEPGVRLRVGSLEIHAVAAAHNGNRMHPLPSRRQAVGYVIRSGSEAIYYAGDTGAGNDFDAIRERFRPRAAILPIGAYAPSWPLQRYHLSPEQAVEVGVRLGVETVVPCHFGTFTLSLDRPQAALPRFAAAAAARGVRWVMPRPADRALVAGDG